MDSVVLHTKLQFLSGWITVKLPRDLYHNCLTKDPFPHSHPMFELHYFVEGNCIVETKSERALCQQGSFLLLPPHSVHRLLPEGESVRTMSFVFGMDDMIAYPKDVWRIPDGFTGGERLFRIREELVEQQPLYAEKIRGELTALLADIVRTLGEPGNTASEINENRAERIQTYLMEHRFDTNCSCEDLAEEMHLSTRQVQRLCTQYYGATFRHLLTSMRMEIADYRLRTTDVSIGELAHQIGYSSSASFSAAYKRYFGVSPSKKLL